ncbi:MAG: N-methyl-L-tryptophan oxidase [Phycisphaerales bacterium]|jgi:sarcosine oxidase|nr:N-methyl-L-tryptophan oxidase [Phycisphaerales bacterium]
MNEQHHDVVVIGLGGVGSAVFAELSRRGIDVLGIDRFESPHQNGSSHGQSRIFRVAYFEHPDYVPLARRSRELWCALQDRNQQRIFAKTGGAWIGDPDCEIVAGSILASEQHDLEHELLAPDEVRRRWPALNPPDDSVCFFERQSGVLCPENAVEAFMNEGVEAGGTIRRGCKVTRLELDGTGILLETGKDRIHAERVVVAAGSWSSGLIEDDRVKLQATRQLLGWTRARDRDLLKEGRVPIWAFADEPDSFQYGFPICDGFPGPSAPKVARHCDGEPCDPDTVRRSIDAADEAFLLRNLEQHVPAASGPLEHATVCLYTLSADHHFVIDQHPRNAKVVMACGFSGHGFKFCPVLGEAIADLVLEGGTERPIGFLSRERLG